jgi:hypothetical protein
MASVMRTVYLLAAAVVVLFVTVAVVAMVSRAPAPIPGPATHPSAGTAWEHDYRGISDFRSAATVPPFNIAPLSRLGGP